MSSADVRGRFVWHELSTTDTTAASAFYTKVIGWKSEGWQQDPSYTLFVAQNAPMAGLMRLPEHVRATGAPPCWLPYIGTPDIDATARLAAETGGSVLHEPTTIPSVGRFAVLRDPQGAVFAAMTPAWGPEGDVKPTLGDFSWHELITTDWTAAFAFYQRLFGWEKTESMDMGPEMGIYQMYGWQGKTLGGMFNKPASIPAPPHWLPYALVADAKKTAVLVNELGGRVVHGPMEVPGGDWIVQFIDPQGAVFAVHSVKPAAQRPVVEKPVVKKAAAKKAPAKKAAVKKPAAKKAPAKKTPAKKTTVKKAVAKKTGAKKAPTKKPARKTSGAKKAPAKKPARTKPARKRAAVRARAVKKPTKKAGTARNATARRAAKRPVARAKPAARGKRR